MGAHGIIGSFVKKLTGHIVIGFKGASVKEKGLCAGG